VDIPANAPLHLLHQCATGVLATRTRQPDGYPYPSALPFVTDERHWPVLLVSRLAEHTRNLLADPRVGFLVFHAAHDDVLSGQRLTLTGHARVIDASPALRRRYLRYQPAAERYLALGDFSFVTIEPDRLRYIGGFGAMGWLDAAEIDADPPLDAALADELIAESDASLPERLRILGLDRYGADLMVDGIRTRFVFPQASVAADAAGQAGESSGEQSRAQLQLALGDCLDRYR
jgi:putative heme iron utilization protein